MTSAADMPPASAPRPTAAAGRVLLVEDDPEIAGLLAETLGEHGFAAALAGSGEEMDAEMARETPDVVLLDVMLPGEDGFDICRRLRAASSVPIIMLTARRADIDRIVGLEIGADDYVTKPFNSREVVARIRALLRRTQGGGRAPGTGARPRPLSFDGWTLDPTARRLLDRDGVRVALTSVEFDLLAAFCRSPGQVLSREQLIEAVHGGLGGPVERSVDVHVSRIRQKLEADPRDPALIRTVRLAGYVFTPEVREA
ncbi:MAG: response regulator transcription factor [Pseudomonadota bacterium]|nr:response regulator transcription factor [Pseudomonadota bacterium]MEE3101652.1 response regulator transcription factor [Pseudomonadota bacterium]